MTTLIIDIKDRRDAKKIADALRLMDSVMKITIAEESPDRIPGLPYTKEERAAAVRRAEKDYTAGRFATSDELKIKHPRICK